MKHKNARYFLIMTLFAIAILSSCNGRETLDAAIDTPMEDTEEIVNIDTMDLGSLFECETEDNNVIITFPEPKQETTPTPEKKQSTNKPSYGRKETLYISTYAANGKVWGHVTMNGNTGRGTIHDDDENSYSITVTRHGNELHGTDQNGRLYVFKL